MVIAECGGGKVEGGQITELAFPDIALTAKVGDKQLHRRIGVLGGVVILQWAIDCVCDFMRDDFIAAQGYCTQRTAELDTMFQRDIAAVAVYDRQVLNVAVPSDLNNAGRSHAVIMAGRSGICQRHG